MAGLDPARPRPALSLPCRLRIATLVPDIRRRISAKPTGCRRNRPENVGEFSRIGGKPPALDLGGGRSFQLEFLNPIPDLVPIEAQKGGSLGLIPATAVERLHDERPLELFEVDAVRR